MIQRVDQEAEGRLRAVSQFAIFHTVVDVGDTHVDAGSSRLFAVGRYYDAIVHEAGRWLLADRFVRLDTRQLGIGSHDIV